jgi:preprotein translocase subunit YajC
MNSLLTSWASLFPLAEADAPPKAPTYGLYNGLLFILVMFAVLYFLMIRPQRKRQRERQGMIESLKKGDKIITRGGIHGIITLVRDRDVVVKVDDNCKLTLAKAGVAQVLARDGEEAEKSKS